ncbi:MAG: hypothetical protein HQL75_08245 [Magnetococcales bacterium]|nr:hypothetical protein [Magnetococcales bacterium]
MINNPIDWVTHKNYQRVHAWIRKREDDYRINLENWVMVKFRNLPETPNSAAILDLEQWIQIYLPPVLLRVMWDQLADVEEKISGEL